MVYLIVVPLVVVYKLIDFLGSNGKNIRNYLEGHQQKSNQSIGEEGGHLIMPFRVA